MSQISPKPLWFDRVRPYLAGLLFLFALGYRLVGIGWGLPNDLHNQSYHPDEEVIWTFSQGVQPAQFKFTPGHYNYGTLYLTLLKVGSDVVSGYGGGPKQGDLKSYWQYQARCHMAGRLISAFAGALTAVFVFLMMRRFTRPLGALMAGLFVAIAPAFVVHSRFQTVDVLATMLLTASLYYSTLLLPGRDEAMWEQERKKWLRYALLAALFAGLSAGTKYTGILALLGLLTAIFLSPRNAAEVQEGIFTKHHWLVALLAIAVALAAFVIATPGALLDTANFMRDLKFELAHTSTGHDLLFIGVGSGFAYHLLNLSEGLYPLLFIAGVVGLVFSGIGGQRWLWVLLAFVVPYYFLIGRAEVFFLRYTFPIYPVLAAGFGWWMGHAHERQGLSRIAVGFGILCLGIALSFGINLTSSMTGMDARDEAAYALRGWSDKKPGTTVGLVTDPWYYTPPVIPDSAIMRGGTDVLMVLSSQMPQEQLQTELQAKASAGLAEVALVNEMAASKSPHVIQHVPANLAERSDWDTKLLTDDKPDYVVFSSFEVGDVWRLRNAKDLPDDARIRVDRFNAFDAMLRERYTLVQPYNQKDYASATTLVNDLEYIAPTIWIWKRKDLG